MRQRRGKGEGRRVKPIGGLFSWGNEKAGGFSNLTFMAWATPNDEISAGFRRADKRSVIRRYSFSNPPPFLAPAAIDNKRRMTLRLSALQAALRRSVRFFTPTPQAQIFPFPTLPAARPPA